MIEITELLPLNHGQRHESIPPEARERQIEERNRAGLLRWYTHPSTFGPVVGRVLAGEVRT